jgi:beta-glucosidase
MRALIRVAPPVAFLFVASCGAQPSPNPSATGGSAGMGNAGSATMSAGGTTAGSGGVAGTGGSGGTGGAIGGSSGSAGSAGTGGTTTGAYEVPDITWPSPECTAQVATLIGSMNAQQKAAQMVMGQNPDPTVVTNLQLGNVFSGGSATPPGGASPSGWADLVDDYVAAGNGSSLGIPILYGIDAVHGHNKATSAVIFPHNIGLGCGNNPALVEEIGQITALEVAATGMTWTFAPMLSVSHDDRWGRAYESYSEDPDVVALLGAAATLGLQGRGGLGTGAPGIVACAKHFAGDGQATFGTSSKGGTVDRGNVEISEEEMRRLGVGPYELALQAGLGSVMVSDARWDEVNMTQHEELLMGILKGELGFPGFVATDWQAASAAGGFLTAANAGVDMFMEPTDWAAARDALAALPTDRLNDAASRILAVKCQAGLFDWQRDTTQIANVGSAAHREVARRAVRESMVLLQNNNTALPLAKGSNVWVGGSGANSLTRQCGGWTVNWQGDGNSTEGTTVLEAVGKVATVVGTLGEAETAIVVLSEPPYAEFQGDTDTIDTLDGADFQLLLDAKNAGKKVVAILFTGRPVLISDELANADAWIAGWLPGSEGDGVADVLFGDYPPTGKLSHSWPKTLEQANQNMGDMGFDPLFAYGHGLSY